MTTDRTADRALSSELEAIAVTAHDRLHTQAGQDPSAASAAITAGDLSPKRVRCAAARASVTRRLSTRSMSPAGAPS